jgi:hypothetical protein
MLSRAPLALATLAILGCGQPKVEMIVPLAIINFAPADGATEVDLATKPVVCFNRSMTSSVAAGSLVLELESGETAGGQALASGADPHCLAIEHDRLQASSGYVIRALEGLRSSEGQGLAAEVSSRFRTASR